MRIQGLRVINNLTFHQFSAAVDCATAVEGVEVSCTANVCVFILPILVWLVWQLRSLNENCMRSVDSENVKKKELQINAKINK